MAYYIHMAKMMRERQLNLWAYLLVAASAVVAAVWAFVELADEVVERSTYAFDVAVLTSIFAVRNDQLTAFMQVATDIGGLVGVSLLTAVTVAILWHRRRFVRLEFVLTSVIGAAAINVALKLLFARDRPDSVWRLIEEASYSFPSGHAMASCALACAVIIASWQTRWWWLTTTIGVLYVLFVGYSRMYLGVHYPTDILAGWLVSSAWVLLVAGGWLLYVRRPRRSIRRE